MKGKEKGKREGEGWGEGGVKKEWKTKAEAVQKEKGGKRRAEEESGERKEGGVGKRECFLGGNARRGKREEKIFVNVY